VPVAARRTTGLRRRDCWAILLSSACGVPGPGAGRGRRS